MSNARPWHGTASLIVSPLAWALHHQLGSNVAFAACQQAPDRVAIVAGIGALLLILGSGWIAWRAWRQAGGSLRQPAEQLSIFIPLLGWRAAALFAMPIAVQLLADLLVPPCFG